MHQSAEQSMTSALLSVRGADGIGDVDLGRARLQIEGRGAAVPLPAGHFAPRRFAGAAGSLAPDGKWLADGSNGATGTNEVRIAGIADGTTKPVAFGAQSAFSADANWIAYSIGYSETQQDKMRKDKKPIQN